MHFVSRCCALNILILFELQLCIWIEWKLAFCLKLKVENFFVIPALPWHFLLSSVMVGLGQDIGWVAGVSASIRRLDCWQGEDSSCSSGNCVGAEVMVIRGRVGIFLGILSQNRGRNNTHCGRVRFCNGPRWTKEKKAEAWRWMIYISYECYKVNILADEIVKHVAKNYTADNV